jgi:hypothetical protein
MSERDAIIDKIKKLLRMKRGGTPDETATALRMAQELADKHGVHLGDVNPDDDAPASEKLGHSAPIASARIQCECQYAGLVCQQFFHVEVFTRTVDGHLSRMLRRVFRYELTFVGTEWDRQIATYVFHFLVKHFRREWTTKRGRCRNRQAFMWGMYCGICAKLRSRQPVVEQGSGLDLLLVGKQVARRDYVAKHFGKLSHESCAPDSNAEEAKFRGWLAGQATEIRPAVKGDGKETLQLT